MRQSPRRRRKNKKSSPGRRVRSGNNRILSMGMGGSLGGFGIR